MRSQEYRTSSIMGSRKVELNALNRTDSRSTCIKVMASNEVVVRAMNFNVPETRARNILSTDSQICEQHWQNFKDSGRLYPTVFIHVRPRKQTSIKVIQVSWPKGSLEDTELVVPRQLSLYFV